jgi:hypothetical protein
MTKNQLRKISLCILWTGLGIFIIGFAYDTFFAGLPNQEAPAEINEPYNNRSSIADSIMLLGFWTFIAGLLVNLFLKWYSKKGRSDSTS